MIQVLFYIKIYTEVSCVHLLYSLSDNSQDTSPWDVNSGGCRSGSGAVGDRSSTSSRQSYLNESVKDR